MVRLWAALMDVGPPSASALASAHTHAGYLANFAYISPRARARMLRETSFFSAKNICANKSIVTGFLRCMSQEKNGTRIVESNYSLPRRPLCTFFDCVERNERVYILTIIKCQHVSYYISPNKRLCYFVIKKFTIFYYFIVM